MKFVVLALAAALTAAAAPPEFGLVAESKLPKQQYAYPVIVRMAGGRLVTAFTHAGGGLPDACIAVSVSDDGGKTWSAPAKALDIPGMNDADPSLLWDGKYVRLYSTTVPPKRKEIASSQVYMVASEDGARWSEPEEIKLPYKYTVGKRHAGIRLVDGTFAMPFSWDIWAQRETPAHTEGEMDLISGVLKSKDGIHWTPYGYLHSTEPKVKPTATNGVAEPALVELSNGELYVLLRTGTNFLFEARSLDNGVTWTEPKRSPLIGHNAPAGLWRLDDHPGEIIVVWNNSPLVRHPLSVSISADGGRSWSAPRNIADSDGPAVSYPNITQAADGTIVAIWQAQRTDGGRDIRYARLTRDWALGR